MATIVKRLFYRAAGSASVVLAPRYSTAFNNSGNWTLSGSDYIITIPESVHRKGINPTVTSYLDNGVTFEEIENVVFVDALGNVTIAVTAVPDNRFTGKIVII